MLTYLHILAQSETSTGTAARRLAAATSNSFEKCVSPCLCLYSGHKFSPHTPQLCCTWYTQRYSQGTTFISQNSPIRCALVAHDDDLGVFIVTHLNIYFSAQGEAEKKNVSLRGSTSGGFNTVSPPFMLLTFTRQANCDGTQRIMGYMLGLGWLSKHPRLCVCIFWKVTHGSTFGLDCYTESGRRLHFSSQHIVLIQFFFLMTHNPLL